MLEYRNIAAKGYVPYWREEVFVIKKVENTLPWTYVSSDLMKKKMLERFMKKNCKKQFRQSLVLKKKSRESVINCILSCLLGLRKLRSSKNVEISLVILVLQIASRKTLFFIMWKDLFCERFI